MPCLQNDLSFLRMVGIGGLAPRAGRSTGSRPSSPHGCFATWRYITGRSSISQHSTFSMVGIGGLAPRAGRSTGSRPSSPHGCFATWRYITGRSSISQHSTFSMVGIGGLEPPTSSLSVTRSNQLSYMPEDLLSDGARPPRRTICPKSSRKSKDGRPQVKDKLASARGRS